MYKCWGRIIGASGSVGSKHIATPIVRPYPRPGRDQMSTDLADKSCVPCKGGVPPLSASEIQPLIQKLDGWEVENNHKLIKSYKFKNFTDPVKFVNAIGEVAEAEGHHPDLYVRWGEVRVYLWTHKVDGLTESDFIMAAKIDKVHNSTFPPSTQDEVRIYGD